MARKLLIATENKGKLKELEPLLAGLGLELATPASLGLRLDVVEDGQSYQENAARKAVAFSRASGLISLADDSGLEVDALDGAPGLHSARYAPWKGASDADRRRLLLSNLTGKPRPWTARFRATIAIATPEGELHFTSGECPGEIIPQERGDNGFGYDPIFLVEQTGRTMAELGLEEKNRLSHRARAVIKAKKILPEIFGEQNSHP